MLINCVKYLMKLLNCVFSATICSAHSLALLCLKPILHIFLCSSLLDLLGLTAVSSGL